MGLSSYGPWIHNLSWNDHGATEDTTSWPMHTSSILYISLLLASLLAIHAHNTSALHHQALCRFRTATLSLLF